MVINKNSKVPILLLIYNDGVITSSRITSISIIKVTTNKAMMLHMLSLCWFQIP
jgi:hypothetical protein